MRFSDWSSDVCSSDLVYLAPGGSHLTILSARRPYCRLVEADPVSGHKPSVDILFGSVARIVGGKAVGAILTGMGMDGARGLLEMRNAGADTFAQDKESCVVYGMPRAAVELEIGRAAWRERVCQYV